MELKERIYLCALYDLYKKLLTQKQQSYFIAYYLDDLSLSEIAENHHVSKSAVHDALKKITQQLYYFEASVGFYAYREKAKLVNEDE